MRTGILALAATLFLGGCSTAHTMRGISTEVDKFTGVTTYKLRSLRLGGSLGNATAHDEAGWHRAPRPGCDLSELPVSERLA